ncbi:MAG: hypothetical protein HQ546_00305 [Planctomycetes bacterium]|nr:hypothetical protein [Planctomycetota bacterium]
MRYLAVFTMVGVLAGPAVGLGAGSAANSADEAPQTKIPKIAFDGVPLARAVQYYSQQAGAKIEMDWPALAEAGVTDKSSVKVKGKDLTLAAALDLTLAHVAGAKAPLSWYIDGRTFRITTQSAILAERSLPSPGATGRRRSASPVESRPSPRPGITLAFDETPLIDAIDFLRDVSELNFNVHWRALQAVGVNQDSRVTVQVKNVGLATALDLVLEPFNANRDPLEQLYWLYEGGVVKVSTGEVLNRRMVVHVFNVSDLLAVKHKLRGPTLGLSDQQGGAGGRQDSGQGGTSSGSGVSGYSSGYSSNNSGNAGRDDDEEQLKLQEQALIDVFKGALPAEFWEPMGKGSIRILNDKMIIMQSQLGFKLMGRVLARS